MINPLNELADYVCKAHVPELAHEEGHVYRVWHDFEITLAKSGSLRGFRQTHTIHPGLPGVYYAMPLAEGIDDTFAYVTEQDANYIKDTLKSLPNPSTLVLDHFVHEYGLTVHTEGMESIIRTPTGKSGANLLPPFIKGLIYNNKDKRIVCPGIIATEDIRTPEEFDYFRTGSITAIAPALDGVLFRVYYDGELETWRSSTSGQINANHGWGGRSFKDLFSDPAVQECIVYTELNKGYCYYVLMEHKEHWNVIPHATTRAILVDVVTCTFPFLEIDPMKVNGFAHVQTRYGIDDETLSAKALFDLAEQYKIGIIVYLRSMRRIRIDSSAFRYIFGLRPNVPDVYKQWIHKLRRPCVLTDEPQTMLKESEQDIVHYLTYYAWHSDKFSYMRARFQYVYSVLCFKQTHKASTFIPKRLVKFWRGLTPAEQDPLGILRKLINADENHLFYLMNPYNEEDK